MEFASKHLYISSVAEEAEVIDEDVMNTVDRSGGLSALAVPLAQQQQQQQQQPQPQSSNNQTNNNNNNNTTHSAPVLGGNRQSLFENDSDDESEEQKNEAKAKSGGGFFGTLRNMFRSKKKTASPPPYQTNQRNTDSHSHHAPTQQPFPPPPPYPASQQTATQVPPPASASASASASSHSRTHKYQYRRAVDTNVMCIKFSTLLKSPQQVMTGQPLLCHKCQAALNHLSRIYNADQWKEKCKEKQNKQKDSAAALTSASSSESSSVSSLESESGDSKSTTASTATELASTQTHAEEKKEFPPVSYLEEEQEVIVLQSNEAVWPCEFCHHSNILNSAMLEQHGISSHNNLQEEMQDAREYILDESDVKVKPKSTEEKSTDDQSTVSADDGFIVFCVDTSGSMNATIKADNSFKLKYEPKPDPLFNDPSYVSHIQPSQGKYKYISRLQAVQTAVDKQLEDVLKKYPNKRIVLVTFSSTVIIYGDGSQPPKELQGDILFDEPDLTDCGQNYAQQYLPVQSTHHQLEKTVWGVEATGMTALGPALLVSLAIASKQKGSVVVCCTDGLANVGLGSLESIRTGTDQQKAQAIQWYSKIGEQAKDAGTIVNIITIEGGGETALEHLGIVSAKTGGDVDRVNPLTLTDHFNNSLENLPIATNVTCTFFLHRGLTFRNEIDVLEAALNSVAIGGIPGGDNSLLSSKLKREIGNVQKDSETLLEYGLKESTATQVNGASASASSSSPVSELLDGLNALPFQVHINYTALSGAKCVRILTACQPITHHREVAESTARVDLLSAHVAKKSADLAARGYYKQARANLISHQPLMNRTVQQAQQQHRDADVGAYSNYMSKIVQFDQVLQEQRHVERKTKRMKKKQAKNSNASAAAAPSSNSSVSAAARRRSASGSDSDSSSSDEEALLGMMLTPAQQQPQVQMKLSKLQAQLINNEDDSYSQHSSFAYASTATATNTTSAAPAPASAPPTNMKKGFSLAKPKAAAVNDETYKVWHKMSNSNSSRFQQ